MVKRDYPNVSIILLVEGSAITAGSLLVAAALTFALASSFNSTSTLPNEPSSSVSSPLGGGALSGSLYTEAAEDDGIAASLGVGAFLLFLSPFIGRLLVACREPQKLRAIYDYSRLERPG